MAVSPRQVAQKAVRGPMAVQAVMDHLLLTAQTVLEDILVLVISASTAQAAPVVMATAPGRVVLEAPAQQAALQAPQAHGHLQAPLHMT